MQGWGNLGCMCTHLINFPASPLFFPNTCSSLLKQLFSKSTAKWATANVQLILQHCFKTSWIAMARATSLFNLFCRNVPKQFASFLSLGLLYLKANPTQWKSYTCSSTVVLSFKDILHNINLAIWGYTF